MDQKQLMLNTLKETYPYGQRLAAACLEIGDCFQQGQKQQGITLLKEFIEGVEWFSYAMHLTEPVRTEKNVTVDLEELPGSLNSLVAALQNQDYGLVADILNLELRPVLDSWSKELAKVCKSG